jgi:hypothetical protein
MREDAIADLSPYERLGHKMPGIEAVYDHPTDRMRPALMIALQPLGRQRIVLVISGNDLTQVSS